MDDIYTSVFSLLSSNAMGEKFTSGFSGSLDELGWLDFAQDAFTSGLFAGQLDDMVAKNKDKSFDEVFEEFKKLYANLINPELMEEAYIATHPDSDYAKSRVEPHKQKSAQREKQWVKNLVYLDVAISKLSPEDAEKYNDPKTPQSVKDKLIQGKLQEAIADVDKMPADRYNKLAEVAKKRHHNNLLEREMGSQLEELINNPNLSKEQREKLFPVFKKYLDLWD